MKTIKILRTYLKYTSNALTYSIKFYTQNMVGKVFSLNLFLMYIRRLNFYQTTVDVMKKLNLVIFHKDVATYFRVHVSIYVTSHDEPLQCLLPILYLTQ